MKTYGTGHTEWDTHGLGHTRARIHTDWHMHRVGYTWSRTHGVGHSGWDTQGGIIRVGYKGSEVEKWGSHGVGYSWSGTYRELDSIIGMHLDWDTG